MEYKIIMVTKKKKELNVQGVKLFKMDKRTKYNIQE